MYELKRQAQHIMTRTRFSFVINNHAHQHGDRAVLYTGEG